MRTIAENILGETTSRTGMDLYEYRLSVCKRLQEDIDQDWDNETTTYYFSDGSYIVDHNGELKAYTESEE